MYPQILSDQSFSIYSDFSIFKALKYINKRNAIISQSIATSVLSLVSLETRRDLCKYLTIEVKKKQ